MKCTKPLRDSGDMLQTVILMPIFNWISRSLTNTTAKQLRSHNQCLKWHTRAQNKQNLISVPDYMVSVTSVKKLQLYNPQGSYHYHWFHQLQHMPIQTRSVLQSYRSSHYCYPVLGLSHPAHWSHKHSTRHCRQATSCYCCFSKGQVSH